MKRKPEQVNILGTTYKVIYEKEAINVDIHKRYPYAGQTDYWTQTIRIHDDGTLANDSIFQTLVHEICHVISEVLHIEPLQQKHGESCNDDMDLVALGIADVLLRNGFVTFD